MDASVALSWPTLSALLMSANETGDEERFSDVQRKQAMTTTNWWLRYGG
jgi:hypothetical protein